LHPGRQPVNQDRLAGSGHLPKALAQVRKGGDERPVRLAVPERGEPGEQQIHAVADLGLGDPDHPTGPPVGQSIQQDRGDGVQADLQGQRWVAIDPWRSRWQQVGQAAGQVGEDRGGQRRTRAV
jgi:hypothetical protein